MALSSYLHNSLERLVALLVGPRLGQVAAHTHVLAQEDLEIQIEFGNYFPQIITVVISSLLRGS